MRYLLRALVFLLSGGVVSLAAVDQESGLSGADLKRIASGECLVLERRPGESATIDTKFVTTARLITGARERIWEVINDKENAADFVEGVLESKVLEKSGDRYTVEQHTHVGGPKGAYRYRLLYALTPKRRVDFTYVGGELRDVIGSWWIFDGSKEANCLVIYSLHIDAGIFAPQSIVKAGMRKSMPKTMSAIAKEVARRDAGR